MGEKAVEIEVSGDLWVVLLGEGPFLERAG